MTLTLPVLGYGYDALEPVIDEQTMILHHTKHHQAYIDKFNEAFVGTDYENMSLEEILQSIPLLPEDLRAVARNHGGGHWNHSFFWQCMTPGGSEMSPNLKKLMLESFGSVDNCKTLFAKKSLSVFGSGRAWLVKDGEGLDIVTTPNQDNPLMVSKMALLGLDVWEHAYYLKYQNKRADYINNWWNIVDWKRVEELFEGEVKK